MAKSNLMLVSSFVSTGKKQSSNRSHDYHQAVDRIKHLLLLEIKIDILNGRGKGDTMLAQKFTVSLLLASQRSSL